MGRRATGRVALLRNHTRAARNPTLSEEAMPQRRGRQRSVPGRRAAAAAGRMPTATNTDSNTAQVKEALARPPAAHHLHGWLGGAAAAAAGAAVTSMGISMQRRRKKLRSGRSGDTSSMMTKKMMMHCYWLLLPSSSPRRPLFFFFLLNFPLPASAPAVWSPPAGAGRRAGVVPAAQQEVGGARRLAVFSAASSGAKKKAGCDSGVVIDGWSMMIVMRGRGRGVVRSPRSSSLS